MIINLKIDNYKGIEKETSISCIASNRIKRRKNKVSKIDENTNLLKSIGIIGCNGSGKTSILSAVHTIQHYLSFPLRKNLNSDKEFNDFINSMNEKELREYLKKINTLFLGEQNINRKDDKTIIEIEIFVPKRDNNIPGFYDYKIIYNKNYHEQGAILEELSYREKYSSKKKKLLSKKENIIESHIGTCVMYQNNNINIASTDNIAYYNSFMKEMVNYTECIFGGSPIDITSFFSDNKNVFIDLCNAVDDKIVNVTIDENADSRDLLFWNKNKNSLFFSQLSEGTRKMIIVGCVLLDSLYNDSVILLDEIEQSLHYSLVNFLINIISSRNNGYCQLFFTTHSPLISFSMQNDELYFIYNHSDDYFISNISQAIHKGIITKDQNVKKAWLDNLLIKNPDTKKIAYFLSSIKKQEK